MLHSPPLVGIVEDEASVRKALGRLLRSASLSAETYGSGEEFLDAVSSRAPDCLLLDVQLPGMNGLALHRRLRKSGFIFPVIFITATNDLQTRQQALQSGAMAWLCKPVDDQELLETIGRALSGAYASPH